MIILHPFWLSGTVFPVFIILSFILIVTRFQPINESYIILLLIAILTVRTFVFAAEGGSGMRYLASMYNNINLFIGFAFYTLGKISVSILENNKQQAKIISYRINLLMLLIFLWYLSLYISYIFGVVSDIHFNVPYLADVFSGMPTAIKSMFSISILGSNWFLGGFFPRVNFLGNFTVEGAYVSVSLCFFAIFIDRYSGRRRDINILSLSTILVVLMATISRALILSVLIASVFSLIWFTSTKSKGMSLLRLYLLIISLIPLVLILLNLDTIISYVLESRKGSTETRFYLYELGIRYVWEQNPIFGLGNKPMLEGLKYPIGSHSTIISMFTKGGFLAVFCFVLFIAIAIRPWLFVFSRGFGCFGENSSSELWSTKVLFIFFIMTLGYMATTDIDAAPLSSAISLFGLGLTKSWIWHLRNRATA